MGSLEILSVPVTTLQMMVSRKAAEFFIKNEWGSIGPFFKRIIQDMLRLGGVFCLVLMLFSNVLTNFLKSPSFWPILILGLCSIVVLLIPIPMGILQGLHNRRWFALIRGLTGPSRFVFCSLAVIMGGQLVSVLFGLFLSQVFLWTLGYYRVKTITTNDVEGTKAFSLNWKDSLPIILSNGAFALLSQMDLFFVNRFFSSGEAAQYTPAVVLARSNIHIAGAMVLAMFPMVAHAKFKKVDPKPFLVKALLMAFLISGFCAALFFTFPRELLAWLYSNKYDDSAEILKYYGLVTMLLCVLMIQNNYFLAQGRFTFGYILIMGVLVEIGTLFFLQPSLLRVIFLSAGVMSILVLSGFVLIKYQAGRSNLKVIQ